MPGIIVSLAQRVIGFMEGDKLLSAPPGKDPFIHGIESGAKQAVRDEMEGRRTEVPKSTTEKLRALIPTPNKLRPYVTGQRAVAVFKVGVEHDKPFCRQIQDAYDRGVIKDLVQRPFFQAFMDDATAESTDKEIMEDMAHAYALQAFYDSAK